MKMTENSKKATDLISNVISQTVPCKKIYLFGSYAYGTPNEDSDYDFYVVIPDEGIRSGDATSEIYSALHRKIPYEKPIDILVRGFSDFEGRKNLPTIEKEVATKGVVLYESA